MGGRLEDLSADQMEGPRVGQSVGQLVGQLVGQSVGQLVGQSVGQSVGRWAHLASHLQRVPVQPLLEVVQWSLCRQKRRPTCYPVEIVLHRHGLFLQKFLVSPWWHPFHPHGAA